MSFPGMTDFSCVRSRAIGCHLVSSSISHVFLSCRFPVVVQNPFEFHYFSFCVAIWVSVCSLFQSALLLISSTRLSRRSFDSILSVVVFLLFLSWQFRLCNFLDDMSQTSRFSFSFLSSRVIPKLYPPVERDGILFCGWTHYLGGAYMGALLSWAMDQDCLWWRWNVGGLPESCMS